MGWFAHRHRARPASVSFGFQHGEERVDEQVPAWCSWKSRGSSQWPCRGSCLPSRHNTWGSRHTNWYRSWPYWALCHYLGIQLMQGGPGSLRIDLPASRDIVLAGLGWRASTYSRRSCGRRKRRGRHLFPWLRGLGRWVSRLLGWWSRRSCHPGLWWTRCWWSCNYLGQPCGSARGGGKMSWDKVRGKADSEQD